MHSRKIIERSELGCKTAKTPLEFIRIKLPSIDIFIVSTLQVLSIYGKSESTTLHNDSSNNWVIYGLLSGTFVELSITCKIN